MKQEVESNQLNKYYIKIGMLSPEKMLEISCGEVSTAETLNYRNNHPASNGLFSEIIFGPVNDWECRCGKYKKKYYKGIVCDVCGVEVTSSSVRRERFGHIELGCNIVLPQYLYGNPSILSTVLDIPQNYLENIVFLNMHLDVEKFWTYQNKLQAIDNYMPDNALEECGTNALKIILENIDIKKELASIDDELESAYGYLAQPFLHRKEVLESFISNSSKPDWMIVSRILVLPVGLRPIIEYKRKLYSSELNDRYRIVIQRCRLLDRLMKLSAPNMIVMTQKRMVQLAVDTLFDGKLEKEEYDKTIHESLISRRQKRFERFTDYSAAGMVIEDASIDVEKIGIPSEIAVELFRPYIANNLITSRKTHNIKAAFKRINNNSTEVLDILKCLENTFFVCVSTSTNRISAHKVQIINDEYFRINPMIYRMWELDRIDNKKIKVYVQLSDDCAEESIEKLGIESQILSAYTEELQILPSQYAINWLVEMSKMEGVSEKKYISKGEAYCAFENGCLKVTEGIVIHCHTQNGFDYEEKTTLGRIIINDILPQNMGVINRSSFKNKYLIEHNYEVDIIKAKVLFYQIYNMFGSKGYLDFLRKYEEVLHRYYNAVDVEYDAECFYEPKYRSGKVFFEEMSLIKKLVANMVLDDSDGEVEQVQLQHMDLKLVEFIKDYLVNRKVAKNVYIYADILLSEGEILTRDRIQELYNKKIERVSIYVSNTTVLGICSKNGFGREVKGNPFKISVLAINDIVGKMPYHEAQSFLSILLGEGMIKTNKRIQGLIANATKEGRVGRNIEHLRNREDGELDFTKLNCTQMAEVKMYLLYSLLQENNLKISLRLLELVVKVILVKTDIYEGEGNIILPSENNTLQMYGECALKSSNIDVESKELAELFGKINFAKNQNQVDAIEDDIYCVENGEIEDFDFQLFEDEDEGM